MSKYNNHDNNMDNNQLITSALYKSDKFMTNAPKIDNENFIQQYRALRQHQKDFLMSINLSTKLKGQIFGLHKMKQHKKPDQNQKLVTVIDPFKGRLIMKQKAWLQIQKQKEAQRVRTQKQYFATKRHQEQLKTKKKQSTQNKLKKQQMVIKADQQENQVEQQQKKKSKAENFFGSLLKKFSQKEQKEDEKGKKYKQQIKIQNKSTPKNQNKVKKVTKQQVKQQKQITQKKKYEQKNQPPQKKLKKSQKQTENITEIKKKSSQNSLGFKEPIQLFANLIQSPPNHPISPSQLKGESKLKLNENFQQSISQIPKLQQGQLSQITQQRNDHKFSENGSEQYMVNSQIKKN